MYNSSPQNYVKIIIFLNVQNVLNVNFDASETDVVKHTKLKAFFESQW